MDSALKSLKVAELRDILASVDQPAPKATKPDLIARIIASKEATAAYNAKYAPKDDLLAPPEDLDWDNVNAPPEEPVEPKPAKPVSKQEPAKPLDPPPPPPAAPATAPAPATTTDDDELEKRKARAARFGIPLVEARPNAAPAAKAVDDSEKLKSRASRFAGGTKRAAVESVDAEEEERRKRRAERFGTA